MINNLLILCIGNICRSPLAEALFAQKLQNGNVKVHSAGIGAMINYPADPISQEIALIHGLDLSKHRARQLTSEMLFEAELILTMTREQQEYIEINYPFACGRVYRIGKWGEFDVPDPFKHPREVFIQAWALIEDGVNDWHKRLWK